MPQPDPASTPSIAASTGRVIGIIAVFTALGPAVGALTLSLGFGGLAAEHEFLQGNFVEAARLFFGGAFVTVLFAVPLGYMLGVVPAALTGAAVAAFDQRSGRPSLRVALVVAALIGVLFALGTRELISTERGAAFWSVALISAHLVSALVCGALAKAVFRRPMRTG